MRSSDIIDAVARRACDERTRTDQVHVYLPKIRPTLTPSQVDAYESDLGVKFPPTLRRIYTEVGDGGFGPGYGFLPMSLPVESPNDSIVQLYTTFSRSDPSDPTWAWPPGLIPITDWGCAIRTCVRSSDSTIVVSDPNLHESDWSDTFLDQNCTLDEWLQRWCEGVNLWRQIYGKGAT